MRTERTAAASELDTRKALFSHMPVTSGMKPVWRASRSTPSMVSQFSKANGLSLRSSTSWSGGRAAGSVGSRPSMTARSGAMRRAKVLMSPTVFELLLAAKKCTMLENDSRG
jgi:hypothetical protein